MKFISNTVMDQKKKKKKKKRPNKKSLTIF